MEKKTDRQKQAEQTRMLIIKKTKHLMKKNDVSEISVRDICAAANVSIGTFYHYFSCKDELLTVSDDALSSFYEKEMKGNIKGQSYQEKILSYFEHICEFSKLWSNTQVSMLYRTGGGTLYTFDTEADKGLAKLIEEAQNQGNCSKQYTAREVTDFLLSISYGIQAKWMILGRNGDLNPLVIRAIRMALPLFFKDE